ncbi:MAG: hypothetical protein GY757_33645 [bacterium]|nr:hypothetical protein [bacterium]
MSIKQAEVSATFTQQELFVLLGDEKDKLGNKNTKFSLTTVLERSEVNSELIDKFVKQFEHSEGDIETEYALLLKDVLSYEDKMFKWFNTAPENAKNFMSDPVGTFKKVSGAPGELIEKLTNFQQTGSKNHKHRSDLEMDTVDRRTSGDQMAAPKGAGAPVKITDLAVGWDAVYAMHQNAVNEVLISLQENGIIPKSYNQIFDVSELKCNADVTIGAPNIIDGNNRRAEIKIPLDGEISVKKKRVTLYTIEIEGHATFTINLGAFQASLKKYGESYVLSVEIPTEDIFEAVDLSGLSIVAKLPIGPEVEITPKDYEDILIGLMNNVIASMAWPLKFQFELASPISLDDARVRFTYTNVPGDPGKNLFGVLLSKGPKVGRYELLPGTIHNSPNSNTAFIFSNKLIMESMLTLISNGLNESKNSFEITGDYPATLQNSKKIAGEIDGLKWRFKKKGWMKLYIDGQEKLFFDSQVDLKSWYTVFYQNCKIKVWGEFSTDNNGTVIIKFESKVKLPWWLYLIPIVKIIIEKIIEAMVRGEKMLSIPNFYSDKISSPAYIQLSGHWKKQ